MIFFINLPSPSPLYFKHGKVGFQNWLHFNAHKFPLSFPSFRVHIFRNSQNIHFWPSRLMLFTMLTPWYTENGVSPPLPPKALWDLLFALPFLLSSFHLRVENSLVTFPVLRVSATLSKVAGCSRSIVFLILSNL